MNAAIDTGIEWGGPPGRGEESGILPSRSSRQLTGRLVRAILVSGIVLGWVGAWGTGSFAQEASTDRPARSTERLSDQMKRAFHLASNTTFAGAGAALLPGTALPEDRIRQWTSMVFPRLRIELPIPPQLFLHHTTALLYQEITKRLGIRYRFRGTDDSGYDCSGFVWRVFQSAGGDFDRVAARTLWAQLPEASGDEKEQFGTLVFFNGLKHVGIVRDANTFYHASRTKGVTLSSYDGYWGRRITGFRRAPSIAP